VGRETEPAGQGEDAQARRPAPHAGESPGRGDASPASFNLFRQPWLVAACLLLAASATLLLLSRPDAAFVCAALGVSAWFWNVRAGLKRKHNLKKLSGRNWVQRGDEEDED
jgi:hypothetical protein